MAAHDERLDALTRREREVLDLVNRGLTNEEIAQRLGITLDGAKYHVSQILSKLGVSSRDQAAALAQGRGVPWRRLAGAAVVAASLAGIAVLAWSVLANEDGDDGGAVSAPTATPAPGAFRTSPPTQPTAGDPPLIELPPSDHPAFDCPEFDTSALDSGVYAIDFQSCAMKRVTDGEHDYPGVWAPDGGRVAFTRLDEPDQDANSDLFIVNADGTGLMQLTSTPNVKEDDPQWSPDGLSIAYTALSIKEIHPDETGLNDEELTNDLKPLDVVTLEQRVIMPDIPLAAFEWSPGGSEIAVVLASSIMAVNVQTGRSRMLATDSAGRDVVWSPDGSMIAYTCTTRDLPGLEFTCVVARDGGPSRLVTGSTGPGPPTDGRLATGRFPQWSSDGRLVISHDGQLYSVDPVTAMPVGRIGSLTIDPVTAMPVGRIGRMSLAWYDDGLVYGSRCVDLNVTPCQREAILHDYGSGLTYGFASDIGLRWSGDRLRASFAIGFYGVGIA